jgi:peptidyl-tRNA hydrolase
MKIRKINFYLPTKTNKIGHHRIKSISPERESSHNFYWRLCVCVGEQKAKMFHHVLAFIHDESDKQAFFFSSMCMIFGRHKIVCGTHTHTHEKACLDSLV